MNFQVENVAKYCKKFCVAELMSARGDEQASGGTGERLGKEILKIR
ncbi:MAG: hypothetical protein JSV82_08060 [Planctomycetota bacterium]|nr:MAG: hypothetical protein JSV82_08060 [Planctomycetota bacterium]